MNWIGGPGPNRINDRPLDDESIRGLLIASASRPVRQVEDKRVTRRMAPMPIGVPAPVWKARIRPGLLRENLAHTIEAMLAAIDRGTGERVHSPNADDITLPSAAPVARVFDPAAIQRIRCINKLKRLEGVPVPDLDSMTFQAIGRDW